METWGWLVAYVLGFGLLQLLLYRYFQRDDPSPDATPGPSDQSVRRSVEGSTGRAGGEAGVQCEFCGTTNPDGATFSYCKECVRPLRP